MFTNWRRATLWAKPVVILFGPNSFVWLSPYRPLSITSLKRQSSDQILSGFWSWKTIFASAKECLVHISLNHWSAPRKLGLDLVSVNSKTNLNFFLPHFFLPRCTSSSCWQLMLCVVLLARTCELIGRSWRFEHTHRAALLIFCLLVWVIRHYLSAPKTATPWYSLVPLGTFCWHQMAHGTVDRHQLAWRGRCVPTGPDTRRTTREQDDHSCLPSWTAWQ